MAKNIILKTITYLAFMMAVVSGYLTEVEYATQIILLTVSLAWICLYTLVNGKDVL